MGSAASERAIEAFEASVATLVGHLRRASSASGSFGADPLRDQADACLDGLTESARVDAMLAAFRVQLTARYAEKTEAMAPPAVSPGQHTAQEMGVVSEVACALTVSERSASALLAQSHELTTTLPRTLATLQDGDISWQHARIMVDETTGLDPAGAAALEAHFLDPDLQDRAQQCPAGDMVPSRFRHKARTWREWHHPVSIEKRHAKSVLDRRLEYAPDRDGMAWLSAYLPADQAAGIWNGVTTAARALQGPTEGRTMTQLRADVVAKLLLSAGFTTSSPTDGSADPSKGSTDPTNGNTANSSTDTTTGNSANSTDAAAGSSTDIGAGGNTSDDGLAGRLPVTDGVDAGPVPSPAAQVLVTVPVFALMGLTGEPATLDGYGPIPASMARTLVADGASSFHRVLIDPRDGAPLEIGRASYRIPAAMRQWLRMRDGKCSFPGCSNQSFDNEADHILAWADGGTTGISNLGQPCPKHHRLRHSTGWKPTGASIDKPPGWISPTGRHYKSEHQDWEPPQYPQQILGLLSDQSHSPAVPEGLLSNRPSPAVPEDDVPQVPVQEWACPQGPQQVR